MVTRVIFMQMQMQKQERLGAVHPSCRHASEMPGCFPTGAAGQVLCCFESGRVAVARRQPVTWLIWASTRPRRNGWAKLAVHFESKAQGQRGQEREARFRKRAQSDCVYTLGSGVWFRSDFRLALVGDLGPV